MKHIFNCPVCKTYTLRKTCQCGTNTANIIPLKYVPGDKYQSYRRKAKRKELEAQGLL